MSDEFTRSAHGNPPHHGPSEGTPAWWVELARTDLPDDPHVTTAVPQARAAVTPPQPRRPSLISPPPLPRVATAPPAQYSRTRERLGNTMVLVMVVVAAILVTWVGMGDPSPRGMVV